MAALLRLLIMVPLVAFGHGLARAQNVSPDSLVVLGMTQLANGRADSARVLFRRALERDSRSARASVGLGRIALDEGDEEEALRRFQQAEEWERRKGHLEYGEGLIALTKNDAGRAKSRLRAAFRRDPGYADALLQLAILQTQSVVERFTAKRTFRRVLEIAPGHPTAYLELGKAHESEGRIDEAISYYEAQLRVNPENGETLMVLGKALLEKQRYWHARQRLFGALERLSGTEAELTLALAMTYLGDRQFARAHDAFVQAFGLLSDEDRAPYEDITQIASAQEAAYFARVSGQQRSTFLQKFWLRRDPTPITIVNERMLEHFRRVWYASNHFSKGRQSWDDRGNVYIRYGEPDHRTSSTNPNFTTNADIDVIRDRYMYSIYGPSPPEVLQRGRLPIYPPIDPEDMKQEDFLSQLGQSTRASDQESDPTGMDGSDAASASDRTPTFDAESGIASLMRWEEWTYVSIGNGLQVTFVDRIGRGDYQYATPPPTTNLRMASALRQYASEEQVDVAREHTPDRYIYDTTQDPLDFYYYLAQFRTPSGATQVDVYFGLPTSEISFQAQPSGVYKATIQSGLAVFDTLWNIKGRISEPVELVSPSRPDQTRGAIHVDRRAVLVPGGERILLSVQAQDLVSGRMQAYRENIRAVQFDSTRLAMSDIILAGAIRRADTTSQNTRFVRNGLTILPMASRSFRRGQGMYVYFEIYNLTRGEEFGDTEYEVEHAVRSGGAGGGSILGSVGRILGGSRRRVGVSRIMEGFRSAEYQNFQIDTSNLSPGTYTLLITVTDHKGDQRVTKERTFTIGE